MKKKISVYFISILVVTIMVIIPTFFFIFGIIISNPKNKCMVKIKHYCQLCFDPKYKDELKTTNTKNKIRSLKSALYAYQCDIGRFPYVGNNDRKNKKSAYNQELLLSPTDSNKNVLVTQENKYMEIKNYERRWKGPYMEGQLSDFMVDDWDMPFRYVPENKNIYLWSYGANKKPDFSNVEEAYRKQNNKNVDDIVISIYRSRYIFED
jgi:hypothetical protein